MSSSEISTAHQHAQTAEKTEILIAATGGTSHYWRECWRFRELALLLVWRDVVVRYKQTVIGVAWAVVRPAVSMIVFTVVFGRLANLPSHDLPYPLLVIAGMLAWQFFASTLGDAGNSLIGNANMIAKVYFPRVLVPLTAIAVGIVDFAFSTSVFAVLCLWYGFMPSWQILLLPLFLLLAGGLVFGCSLWVAALNVSYRDFRYLLPFVIQFGAYLSPVGFSSAIVPEQWRLVYALNPMVGIIDGFRWSLLRGATPIHWDSVGISVVFTLILVYTGLRFFRRMESTFADVI